MLDQDLQFRQTMLIQEMPYVAKAPDKADMKRRILYNNMHVSH